MATEQKRILIRRGNKADLVVTDLQPGELVLALDTNEIGVKTSGGTVLWFATLDANGKAKQDPASYGQANGGATLNADGKVIQDPASYGQANGGATLNADEKVIQDPASYGKAGGATLNPNKLPTEATIMALINGTLTPAEFEAFAPGVKTYSESVNKNGITGSEYCIQFPSGTLIYAGLLDGLTVSTSTAAGSLYVNSADLNYTVSSSFPSMTAYYYSKVNAKSTSYLLVPCNDRFYPASKQVACTIMSPSKTTNTPYAMSYLVLGRWK